MFYEEFIKLCNEKNIKPTPALKEMGLSTANMQRWKKENRSDYKICDSWSCTD